MGLRPEQLRNEEEKKRNRLYWKIMSREPLVLFYNGKYYQDGIGEIEWN